MNERSQFLVKNNYAQSRKFLCCYFSPRCQQCWNQICLHLLNIMISLWKGKIISGISREIVQHNNPIFDSNDFYYIMFRGSSYSIETDKDISFSNLNQESVSIALVGVSEVGKSSLLNCIQVQMGRSRRSDSARTSRPRMAFNYDHLIVNLSIWDSGGDYILQHIKKGNLDHIDGIIYVYDLSNPTSVINLQLIYTEIRSRGPSDFASLIVGNKADLLPLLSKSTKGLEGNEAYYLAKKFSQRHKMIHQTASAKANNCVTDCFVLIIKEVLGQKRHIKTSRLGDQEEIILDEYLQPQCPNCPACNLI